MVNENSKFNIRPFQHKTNDKVTKSRSRNQSPKLHEIKSFSTEYTANVIKGFVPWNEELLVVEKIDGLGEHYKYVESSGTTNTFMSLKVALVPGFRNIMKKLVTVTVNNTPKLVNELDSRLPLLYDFTIHSYHVGVIENVNIGKFTYADYLQVNFYILADLINSMATIVNVDLETMMFDTDFDIDQTSLIHAISSESILGLFYDIHTKYMNIHNNGNGFSSRKEVFYHPDNKIVRQVEKYKQREHQRDTKARQSASEQRKISKKPKKGKLLKSGKIQHKLPDHMYEEPLGSKPKRWQGLGARPRD